MYKFAIKDSISKRLTMLVSLIVWAAILLGLLVTTVNDVVSTRQAAYTQTLMLADVLARNSVVPVVFKDVKGAEQTLAAVENNDIIHTVEILKPNREVFASYHNEHVHKYRWISHFPALDVIQIERPLNSNDKSLGSIRISAEIDSALQVLVGRWTVNLMILGFALLAGLSMLRAQIGTVLKPIDRLANAAREIVEDQKYSLRVEKTSSDELGVLTEEFNQMLAQIEIRDAQLRQSSEALAQTQEAIALRDEHLCCQYVNPAFTALFGYTLDELKGRDFNLDVDNPPESQLKHNELYDYVKQHGSFRGEVLRQAKDGTVIPVSLQISPVRNEHFEVTGYVAVISDITEKKRAEEVVWYQANFDALTGLPNRHMFNERLQKEIKRSERTGKPFALMFIDLDHFKEVNDSHGHDMGDFLLTETADRLSKCVRVTDALGHGNSVSRLGGDEFTVILTEITDGKNVEIVAKRILEKLIEPYQLGGELVYISASIGITLFPDDASNVETLIKNADQSMYQAKNLGRNQYSYFTRSMQMESQKRRVMINDMRRAIDREEFRVMYQPIVNLATQQIYKAEALLRWQHPERGMVSPAEFIPLAEETGLILELGDWIFYQAANQAAAWRRQIHPNFQISVNKSPVQFLSNAGGQSAWFDYLQGIDLPGDSVVIEITEGLMLDKNALVSEKLLAYRDAGVQIAVDDFGTGYSALAYLKKFDVDYLKIDQSFVRNLSIHSEDMVLCEAIIVMAHKLGMKVIAEGVETDQQRDLLTSIGCDYGQGYLFSRPIFAQEFEQLQGLYLDIASSVTTHT